MDEKLRKITEQYFWLKVQIQSNDVNKEDLINFMNTVGYNHFNNLLFKVINSITECENYSSLIRELTKDNRLVYLPSRKEIFENCKENKNFCLAYADGLLKKYCWIYMKKSENEIELCYGKQEIKINQEKYENLFNFMKDFNVKISKENVFKIIKGLR